jgi:TRAP transporter TAXI family solute receptor
MVFGGLSDTGAGLYAKESSGIKTLYDLKGKKVPWSTGAPGINVPTTAALAFANLTWDDVQKIEFPNYTASMSALKDGTVDVCYGFSDASTFIEMDGMPQGAVFLPMPADDVEGWKRLQEVCPYMLPHDFTRGVDATPEKPLAGGSYPYPLLVSYADLDEELVYNMVKLILQNYDDFKDAHPGLVAWTEDRLVKQWKVPYHDGAIKYFKELGIWTDEDQKYNDALIERGQKLQKAFDEAVTEAAEKQIKANEFSSFWLKKWETIN